MRLNLNTFGGDTFLCRMVVMMNSCLPLNLLAPGETARVVDLCGQTEFVNRLSEMGLQIDTVVRMVRTGSPCIVAVENRRLSLRCDDLATILVEPCSLPVTVSTHTEVASR